MKKEKAISTYLHARVLRTCYGLVTKVSCQKDQRTWGKVFEKCRDKLLRSILRSSVELSVEVEKEKTISTYYIRVLGTCHSLTTNVSHQKDQRQ